MDWIVRVVSVDRDVELSVKREESLVVVVESFWRSPIVEVREEREERRE